MWEVEENLPLVRYMEIINVCATLSSIRPPSDVPFIIFVDMVTPQWPVVCFLALMADAERVETAEIRFDDEDVVMI